MSNFRWFLRTAEQLEKSAERRRKAFKIEHELPSWELAYPILGKGKTSWKVPLGGNSEEGIMFVIEWNHHHARSTRSSEFISLEILQSQPKKSDDVCFRFKNFGTRKMTNIGELTFIQGLGITILPPGFLRLINKKTSNGKTPDGFRSPSKSVHLDKHNLSIVHQVVSFTEKM